VCIDLRYREKREGNRLEIYTVESSGLVLPLAPFIVNSCQVFVLF